MLWGAWDSRSLGDPGLMAKALKLNTLTIFGAITEAAREGLVEAACKLMEESVAISPIQTGALADGAYATDAQSTADGAKVEVGYGGTAEAYIVRQHESPEFNHPGPKNKNPLGSRGRAYFLSGPATAMESEIRKIVADFARQGVEGKKPRANRRGFKKTPPVGTSSG